MCFKKNRPVLQKKKQDLTWERKCGLRKRAWLCKNKACEFINRGGVALRKGRGSWKNWVVIREMDAAIEKRGVE